MNSPEPEDPARRATAATPEAILASTELSRQQKIDRLREMSYDAREMDVAADEGMAGGEPSQLRRIVKALRALGVEDEATDAKQ